MPPLIDMTNQRFGRLVVKVHYGQDRQGEARWQCECDCGRLTIVRGRDLRRGLITSCGCYRREVARKVHTKHGGRRSRLYHCWRDMIIRCECANHSDFKYYGARGIQICAEWRNDFAAFRTWALSHGYSDNLTIDRIDTAGNYEPSNCCWISRSKNIAKRNRENTKNHGLLERQEAGDE